ncbi:ORF6N domain-containing protein [Aquimarina sp. MAR_2010_214]|uniref:ORF6N domain-containing protein n=1 Tax=Aquimarina sp. MAR_2010_214 TaxID=1250026 RepID=UPI000C70C7F9|nr:ORF6N domain-containing protein [Aquimarina sp. MAR_2010_214]PKV53011.1 ORF6N domain-containing protein [Aquimarina sp. MAR_2010_214]PKV53019.1 ORF6N domain-containing protein [Aquimarina sp. MAR_2010_214]
MSKEITITEEAVISKIYIIRDQKVMLDRDLSELYDVTTGNLNKAVGRNIKRFPEDFMFELTKEEYENLKSQFGTSNWGGTRKMPKVFTEQGVAMLSGVLHSDRAIMVNIQIMRAYSKMREMLTDNLSVKLEIEEIKKKLLNHSKNIELVFDYLDELQEKKENPRPKIKIGYKK